MRHSILPFFLALFACLPFTVRLALARAGGGESYGVSSKGSGGSGGGLQGLSIGGFSLDDVSFLAGLLVFLAPGYILIHSVAPRDSKTAKPGGMLFNIALIGLCVFWLVGPTIIVVPLGLLMWLMVPPVFLVTAGYRYFKKRKVGEQPPKLSTQKSKVAPDMAGQITGKFRVGDPNFSLPVFKDFAVLLFTRCFQTGIEGTQSLYLSDTALAEAREGDEQIRTVVVGNASVRSATLIDNRANLEILFEATCLGSDGRRYFREESWSFDKRADVLSPDPETALELGCPNCGANGDTKQRGVCPYCGQKVNDGAFGWTVLERKVREHVVLPPLQLGGSQAEHGTDLPTLVSPELQSYFEGLKRRDPKFDETNFKGEVEKKFLQIQQAWSSGDTATLRRLETESLYNTHRYWLERYRAEGLQNKLSEVDVQMVEIVKGSADKFFDIVPCRISTSLIDVTVDRNGKVLQGHPDRPTLFSEYWTFIRKLRYKEGLAEGCPNCGASLKVDEGGCCEYCEQRLTTGNYGWVLSEIVQDEEYEG